MTDTVAAASGIPDIIDATVPLAAGHSLHALRRERGKVVDATQASFQSLFTADMPDISVVERLMAALHACRLAQADDLAALYRSRLTDAGADEALIDAVDAGLPMPHGQDRIATILDFTGRLTLNPAHGEKSAVEALLGVGLGTPAVVALAQLVSFLAYQIRVVAGLKAMAGARRELA
jgi:uncharacterized protein YciW